MKKRHILVISSVLSVLLSLFFANYLQNYKIFRSWYLTTQYQGVRTTELLNAQKEQAKSKNIKFLDYYLSVNYKFTDLNKSIEIANNALTVIKNTSDSKRVQREFQALNLLLGQLYFYTQQYDLSASHYWTSLLIMPDNTEIRYNYELATKYYRLTNMISPQIKELEERLELGNNKDSVINTEVPIVSTGSIITNSEFFYYYREDSKSINNAW